MKKTILDLKKQNTPAFILSASAQQKVKGGGDDFIIIEELGGF